MHRVSPTVTTSSRLLDDSGVARQQSRLRAAQPGVDGARLGAANGSWHARWRADARGARGRPRRSHRPQLHRLAVKEPLPGRRGGRGPGAHDGWHGPGHQGSEASRHRRRCPRVPSAPPQHGPWPEGPQSQTAEQARPAGGSPLGLTVTRVWRRTGGRSNSRFGARSPVPRSSTRVSHRENPQLLGCDQVGDAVWEADYWHLAHLEVRGHTGNQRSSIRPGGEVLDGPVDGARNVCPRPER
jgi:hypothetical protein